MSRDVRRSVVVVMLASLALSAAGAGVIAQSTGTGTTDVRKSLETRKSELEGTESRAKALEKNVNDLREEREKINARLLETAALVQKSEGQMTRIESRLGELEAQEKLVSGSLNTSFDHISKLLAALQRMGRNPPPVMITRREDALKMVRSAMLLSTAFPGMRTQALALADQLNELQRVMGAIRDERDHLKTETQRLSDMKLRLAGLMESKKQTLNERRSELEKVRTAAAEISRSVGDLSELIQKLDTAVTKNTGLAAYEEETKRQAAATPTPAPVSVEPPVAPNASAEPAAPAPETAVAPIAPAIAETAKAGSEPESKPTELAMALPVPKPAPPAEASPPVVELAPRGTSLLPGNPGRIKPAIAFQLAKAKLPLPAQGRRVLSYGDKTQFGGQSKGIVIETRNSAQITSPCDGWVVYAGEFRSYGQLLIINAGGGYHVLVAGLSQIDVQPGQFVLTAEPVGTMSGAPKSAPANTQSAGPVLYVEFRKDGEPVDPDPWWAESQQVNSHQKVQG